MARFRYAVLVNDEAKTASLDRGTETVDLPENGILSEVTIQARTTDVWVDNTILPMFLKLQKLEVLVDGSTVVKSIDGRQCRALMWYNGGPFGQAETYEANGSSNKGYGMYTMYFGKSANDVTCGLDLGAYANPQLKITWDASITTHDGIVYDVHTDPAFTYNVMCKMIDGTPSGWTNRYVQSREIDNYLTANSTEHNTEIPRGYDLKGIMLGGRYTAKFWGEYFNHVKLDFDNGKWLPIDMDYENLAAAFKSWYPQECEWGCWQDNSNGDDWDTRVMGMNGMGWSTASSAVSAIGYEVFEMPLYLIQKWDPTGAGSAIKTAQHLEVRGWGPHQTIYVPLEQFVDGAADSVRTTDYGRIDLKVKTGASAGTSAYNKVVAEYLKPNGR